MVLDDASPQASHYNSDNASKTGPTRSWSQHPMLANLPLKIKPELAVQPDIFTLYFGFFGSSNWKQHIAKALASRVEQSWSQVGRSLTQEEMDAFTTIESRTAYYYRLGLPIGAATGVAIAYNQMRKTPDGKKFQTPQQIFKAARITAAADKPLLRGILAKQAFNVLFFTSTGAIITWFLSTVSAVRSTLKDPRLRSYVEESVSQKSEDIRKRQLERAKMNVSGKIENGRLNMIRQFQEELDGKSAYDQGVEQESYSYDSSAPAATSSEGPDVSREPQMFGNGPTSQQPSASSDDFFGGSSDDDASPTAPEYRNTNIDGSPAGSTWERIRRQARGPSSQQSAARSTPSQQWDQRQNWPESSTYSSSDQGRYEYERSREKDQAQADFDKLMEAERNASDNGQSRGRGWGWGS